MIDTSGKTICVVRAGRGACRSRWVRIGHIGLVLTLVVAATSLTGCSKVRARGEMQKGNKAYNKEAYGEALSRFQSAVRLDPGATFAYRSLGLSAMAQVKPGDSSPANVTMAKTAVDAFEKYLKDTPPDREKVEDWVVSTWLSVAKFDKAISFLEGLRRDRPGEKRYITAIITIYVKSGQFPAAMAYADKYASGDAGAYYNIATNAWGKSYGDPTTPLADRIAIIDIGLQAAQRAMAIKPDNADAMVYTNLLYREKAKVDLDPARQKQWLALADEWRTKAIALRDRQKGVKPTPTSPGAAKPV